MNPKQYAPFATSDLKDTAKRLPLKRSWVLRSRTLLATSLLAVLTVFNLSGCGTGEADQAGAELAQTGEGPDSTPPTTPTGIAAAPASPSQIDLSWNASTDNVGVAGYRIYRNGTLLVTLGNITTYQNNGLTPSTTYSYTVQAVDTSGNASAQSPAASATTPSAPDTTAPSIPTGLTATAVSPSQINLSWNAATDNVGVTSFRVYRNGALIATLGNVTTYQNTGLSASTSYSYRVQAVDAAGNASAQSAAASATTQSSDTTAPSTPTGLTATAVSPSQINLSWNAATDNVGVTTYRVYRNGTLIATLGNVTSYQNTGLSASTTYTYRVQAVDAAGNASAQSSQVSATTLAVPDTAAPSTPGGLTATAVSSSRIDLNWTASTDNVGVTNYRVYRNGALIATLGNVTTYQNTGLSPSTTYAYTVQALDAAGNASGQSAPVSATTLAAPDTTAPSTPTGLTATAVSSSQINLSWNASTDNLGVTGYRIYRNGTFLASVGNVTTYQSTGLNPSTTYSYRVDAIDAAGNASALSTAASATTQAASGTATLAWDAVSASNLSGYRIYYGTAPGTYMQPLGQGINVGNVTSYTVTGLTSGTRYYFAATAVDTSGNESTFSNEVFKDIP
jgi:chitodextrinase